MKKVCAVWLFLGIEIGVIVMLVIIVLANIFGSKDRYQNIDNTRISMPSFYRKITGYDSIQLIYGGRAKYNTKKQTFDVTRDSLFANFCYPNKWQFNKFETDTIFIHDTLQIIDVTPKSNPKK